MKLYELAFACHIYSQMSGYDRSYLEFLQLTNCAPDLSIANHRIELLTWLNKWGCRQFAKEDYDLASEEIRQWYEGVRALLPLPGKSLLDLSKAELTAADEAYGRLAGRTACQRRMNGGHTRVTVGPTGAAKVLFAVRPEAFAPWDDAIRGRFQLDGSPTSYRAYLRRVRAELAELAQVCAQNGFRLADLPAVIGRARSTPVKLVDEYYWVTVTRNCQAPPTKVLAQWAAWEWRRQKALERERQAHPAGPEERAEAPAVPAVPLPASEEGRGEAIPQVQQAAEPTGAGRTIVLVACVKKKNRKPMPARDLYISPLFHKSSSYARRVGDEWYILSAKYGLVAPDQVIAPYDQTLNRMSSADRAAWAQQVMADLSRILRSGDRVVIVGGERYRAGLVGPMQEMGYAVETPMEGLKFGQQLRWLNGQLEGGRDDER